MRSLKNLFAAASLVFAASLPALAEARTAVVDFAGAIFSTERAEALIAQIEQDQEFVNLRARGESLDAEFRALQEEYQQNELTWSDERKAQANQRAMQLNQQREQIGRTLNQAVQSGVMRELQPKAAEALEELVREEGVTILISADAVLMAGPEQDLTGKLVERINRKLR